MIVYTVGHSTRQSADMIDILSHFRIRLLIDVRSIPRSHHNPQFNNDTFPGRLKQSGITYQHMEGLGGLRRSRKNSPNAGWRNTGFRAYADHMQTPEFETALKQLIEQAKQMTTVIMCAEAVPWRCHRSLITDALLIRDIKVAHILDKNQTQAAALTDFAVVDGTRITYPSVEEKQDPLL